MYLLNLARLFFLFNVALFSMSYFGQSVTVRLLLGLLHSSIGWVIYSAGFVYIYRRYVLAHSPLLSGERAFVYSSSSKTFLLLVLLWSLLAPITAHASCPGGTCIDTGTINTCGPLGDDDWQYYCAGGSNDGQLSRTGTCSFSGGNQCFCGVPEAAAGPCTGCSWRGPGGCFNDDNCTIPCAGAPELGGLEFFSLFRELIFLWIPFLDTAAK